MKDLIWNLVSTEDIEYSIVKARDTILDEALNSLTPPLPGEADTLLQGHTYEVGIATPHGFTEWLPTEERTWRSWTGLRRLDGVDHHDTTFIADSDDPWTGRRDCSCSRCESHTLPTLRYN